MEYIRIIWKKVKQTISNHKVATGVLFAVPSTDPRYLHDQHLLHQNAPSKTVLFPVSSQPKRGRRNSSLHRQPALFSWLRIPKLALHRRLNSHQGTSLQAAPQKPKDRSQFNPNSLETPCRSIQSPQKSLSSPLSLFSCPICTLSTKTKTSSEISSQMCVLTTFSATLEPRNNSLK